jgi:arginine:ornithine antiporter/lysine permease
MTATEPRTEQANDKVSLPTLTAMVDDRVRGISAAAPLRHRDGRPRGDHRLDDRRHRNVDAGLRLSASGDPQTGPGRWDLRVRQAGLGDYVGFNSAIGYWASACAGNTSYWVLITATLSAVVPGFGAGDTVLAVVVSAIGVWLFVFLVLRGVKDAAVINYIVTVAKVVPILVFIVIAIIAFKGKVFADNFWGGGADYSFSSVWDQATGTMLITVFVFLGIEGASVYSRMARNREDVGRATVIGFLSVLSVFAMVTLMSYGVMRLRANWPASANPRWRRCWNPLSDHRDRPSSASV